VPEALDALTAEERHRIYKMLRLEVLAHPDTSLEVSGALVGAAKLGDSGILQTHESQNTQPLGLWFRALLTEGAALLLELSRSYSKCTQAIWSRS
jgi:hypothetical protein